MGAPQQPVAEPRVARGARQGYGANGQDRRDRGVGIELASLGPCQFGNGRLKDVGIGQTGGQRGPGDVAGQGGERAALGGGRQLGLVEIGFQHCRRFAGTQPRQQAETGPDDLGEQIVLRPEVRIKGAAGQAGGEHDVVDVGAGIAAQPEQPGGVIEDFAARAELAGRADWHVDLRIGRSTYHMSINIS